jgi:hypothetical protein
MALFFWRKWVARRRARGRARRRANFTPPPLLEILESRDLPTAFAPAYLPARAPGRAAPMSTAGPTGYTPAQVRHAYGFDQVWFGGVAGDGRGQTIAIVDAYDDPTIASDLHQFDLAFGLPDPVFARVNQSGGSWLPPASATWAVEIALDVEWAHAIAPGANILLVEANSSNNADLFAAVTWAARQPGVSVVSMSWGTPEFASEASFDGTFTTPAGHAGVTFLAAPGDAGAPASYPSASPNVVGVGGTTLWLGTSGSWAGESGWAGGAGGLSAYEARPAYQQGAGAPGFSRAVPEVAYDADPATGFPIYDTYNFPITAPWAQYGGTSAGTPQWAALVAVADQGRALAGRGSLDGPTQTLPALYGLPPGDFHDITGGTSTGTPHYTAGPGYDLVTGRGSPIANLVIGGLVNAGVAVASAAPAWTSLNGTGSAVASGRNADGSQQAFAVGTDGALWVRTQSAGGAWGNWTSLGGVCTGLAVTANALGWQDVFVLGSDGAVWTRGETAPGSWTAWRSLGGRWTSFTAGTEANGTVQVFGVDGSASLWTCTETAPGSWTAWSGLGGVCRTPVVTRNSLGLLDVFVLGSDGAVWTRSETAAGWWSAWKGLGGACRSFIAGTSAGGTEEVFAVGTDGGLWTSAEAAPGQWSVWAGLGGVCRAPAVAVNSLGLFEVFVVGGDGAVWTSNETAAGRWTSWQSLGGLAGSLTTGVDTSGRLEVLADGPGQGLWYRTQTSPGVWG